MYLVTLGLYLELQLELELALALEPVIDVFPFATTSQEATPKQDREGPIGTLQNCKLAVHVSHSYESSNCIWIVTAYQLQR